MFPRKKKRCATRIKSQKTPPRRSQGKYSNIKLVRAPSHPQANSDGLLSYEIFVLFFLHSLNTEFKTGRLDYLFGTNAAVLTCSQQSGSGIPRCAVPVHTNPKPAYIPTERERKEKGQRGGGGSACALVLFHHPVYAHPILFVAFVLSFSLFFLPPAPSPPVS